MSDLPPVSVLEEILHAALKAGDARGIEAALKLIAVQDPHRAESLMEAIKLGLAIRERVEETP